VAVKLYEWPFKANPHTLQVNEQDGSWSMAICDHESYILVAPGHPPEYVMKNGTKVIKQYLKIIEQH
jgi:hypothetical protein